MADAVEGSVDGVETHGTGGGGDVVDIIYAYDIGRERTLRGDGFDIVAHRVGTDGTVDGVEIVGVGGGGHQREVVLPRETTVEVILLGLGKRNPPEVAHIVADRHITGEAHRGLGETVRTGHEGQQEKDYPGKSPKIWQQGEWGCRVCSAHLNDCI